MLDPAKKLITAAKRLARGKEGHTVSTAVSGVDGIEINGVKFKLD